MPSKRYHTTDKPGVIPAEGFRAGVGSCGLANSTLTGVFLSVTPINISDGASGDMVFEVVIPDRIDIAGYAVEEDGHPGWEYCPPSRRAQPSRHPQTAHGGRG